MTDRRAFIDAIIRDPFDDTHRLVFADWLEDYETRPLDHALAWYIRSTVAAAPGEHSTNGFALNAHPPTEGNQGEPVVSGWVHEPSVTEITGHYAHEGTVFPQWSARRWYARGFVYRVGLPILEFLKHARQLFKNHPIVEVELYDRQAQHYYADEQIRRPLIYQWDLCEVSDIGPGSPLPGYLPRVLWNGDEISVDMASRESWDSGRYQARSARSIGRLPRRFATTGLAAVALSRRCVGHGRELAGLPPLAWPKEVTTP